MIIYQDCFSPQLDDAISLCEEIPCTVPMKSFTDDKSSIATEVARDLDNGIIWDSWSFTHGFEVSCFFLRAFV